MRLSRCSVALMGLIAGNAYAGKFNLNLLQARVTELQQNAIKIESAPPARQEHLKQERQQIIGHIRTMATDEPQNLPAQIGVAQGFLASNEPREATGFADRAAALAQEKGDTRTLGSALTIGAVAYQKSGDYESATDRSKRALELDPGNRMAMAVYQMSRGRSSGTNTPTPPQSQTNKTATNAATAATPSEVSGAGAKIGRDSYPTPMTTAAGAAPSASFTGTEAERARKLTAEAGRKWALDKNEALKLLDAAVLADAKNAAARAARARARLESGDAAGALEDADAALAAGPSAAMHAVKGEALLALGRTGEEMMSHFKTASELDASFSPRYQEMIASGGQGRQAGAASSAPDPARRMGESVRGRPSWLLPASGAGLVLLGVISWALRARRKDSAG